MGESLLFVGERHFLVGERYLLLGERHLLERERHLLMEESYLLEGERHLLVEESYLLAGEPYFDKALANRAFARIRKYQFANSRKLSEHNGVTIMASKDNPAIPENELTIICSDLKQAIFLGDKGKMIMEAYSEFCGTKSR